MSNRILARIESQRALLQAGVKPDGTPITADLVAFEKSLDNSVEEHFAYQNAQARAHAMGIINTDEALTIYAALGEVPASNGWAEGTDLASKAIITALMGELIK